MKHFVKGKRYYSIPHHRFVYFEKIMTVRNSCRLYSNGCRLYIFRDICDAILEFTESEAEKYVIE